jgi:hypothetical protein
MDKAHEDNRTRLIAGELGFNPVVPPKRSRVYHKNWNERDILKNICQEEHSRYRQSDEFSDQSAGVVVLSAYNFLPHKLSIHNFCDKRALPLAWLAACFSSNSR